MKKTAFILMLTAVVAVVVIFSNIEITKSQPEPEAMYVGVTSCVGACHKSEKQGSQYAIWKDSKHSQAFKSLQTPFADSIANARGFSTAAAETPACVVCHVLGREMMPEDITDSFDKTEGVQCESCHGPGSEYKTLSIMKDKQKSIEAGLIIHSEGQGFCTNCHNSNSPTFVEFNYAEMWDKIKHPKPAGEE